jgi:hypothetical protein
MKADIKELPLLIRVILEPSAIRNTVKAILLLMQYNAARRTVFQRRGNDISDLRCRNDRREG